jgi:ABC-type dipeptide/oligopeptide/nickel transport system permease component
MVVANLGVSMPIFWLGLLLAALFGVVLKDTPLQLPTGGRMSAGVSLPPLTDLKQLEGLPLTVMTFLSTCILSTRWSQATRSLRRCAAASDLTGHRWARFRWLSLRA